MAEHELKLTLSDLDLCVPLFKDGLQAEEALLVDETYAAEKLLQLETRVDTKRLVVEYLVHQSDGLIRKEIYKLLRSSLLDEPQDAFNQLYYAGVKGFTRGLAKYSPQAKKSSPTNYLFQWVYTYAKRELLALEAPLGMAPTRYEKMKKIAAVRRRFAAELGRQPTNQELLQFFHDGRADMETSHGRKADSGKPSQANLKMKLEDMEEQEDLERRMRIKLIDIQDSALSEKTFQVEDAELFDETIFGAFVSEHEFSQKALAVLKSELYADSTPDVADLVSVDSMSEFEYKNLAKLWSDFLSDPESPFIKFLKEQDQGEWSFEYVTPAGRRRPKHYYNALFKDDE